MSRFLSQSLTLPSSPLRLPCPRIGHHRHRSSKTHLIEADADVSKLDSPEATAEIITVGIKKLEEALHSLVVRRAAPDWLPFLPGYSYWVPPRSCSNNPAGSMFEGIGQLASFRLKSRLPHQDLSEDVQMSLISTKGWPSYAFYIEGTSPIHPLPVVEVEVKFHDSEDSEDYTSNSEDEEG